MLSAFWSDLGKEFAKQWAARVLTPALAFWAGGVSAVWWSAHRAGAARRGWGAEIEGSAITFAELPTVAQGAIVVGGLVLLALSAVVAQRLTSTLLRLLEGYWTRPRALRSAIVAHRRESRVRSDRRLQTLRAMTRRGNLSVEEYGELRRLEGVAGPPSARRLELERRSHLVNPEHTSELARLESRLRRSPAKHDLIMPTRLGDILRASELRPAAKYGLNTVVCWVPLWLVLPSNMQEEVVQARQSLDGAARALLWGAMFVVWTPWAWIALPIGVAVASAAYYAGVLNAAALFGDLVETAFDLYRMRLYDALHLPRPVGPLDERSTGPAVTSLLWGGQVHATMRFVDERP